VKGWYRASDIDGEDAYTITPTPSIYEPTTVGDLLDLGDQQDRYFAVHEAAHAVLARAAGGHISEVALMPAGHGEGPAGHVNWMCPPADTQGEWDDLAAVHAGGEQGAARWLRDRGLHTPVRAWATELSSLNDRNVARRWAGADVVTDDPTSAHDWRRLGALAWERLDERWDEVEELAQDLQKHRRLTPENYPLNRPRRRGPFGRGRR